MTGHMDCPRCGTDIAYSCELVIGEITIVNDDTKHLEVTPTNLTFDHHCKMPEAA